MAHRRAGVERGPVRPGQALAFFIVFVVTGSLGLNAAFDAWQRLSPPARRNPHIQRLWLDHVRATEPRRPGEQLVVIIGNSQADGREVADGETYASRLEERLRLATGARVRVVNWSISGGAGPEFVVLGAAACRLNPDVLLLVATPGNFGTHHHCATADARRRWRSDSHLLVGLPDIRRRIPPDFVSRYMGVRDHIAAGLAMAWPAWRRRHTRREAAQDILRRLGVPAKLSLPAGRAVPAQKAGRPLPPPSPTCWELIDFYLQSVAGTDGRNVFVRMPLRSDLRGRHLGFDEAVRPRFSAAGGEVWDLCDALPDDMFLAGWRTHFNQTGHAEMARLLAQRLAP